MKLEPTENGFVIDAEDLGQLLDRPPSEVQRLMREGAITTRFESGEGEDEGRSRITFFDATRRVRLIVDSDGEVITRSRVNAAPHVTAAARGGAPVTRGPR